MRRFGILITLLCALVAGSFATVAAQDEAATPEANGSAAATGADPAVGATVSYIGSDGDEWATITVEEVIDPFEDYDEQFGAPERGNRFAAIRVTVEATGTKAVEVQPYDFIIQDDQGFIFGNAFTSRTEEQEAADPELEDANLAPGDSVSGLIIYQVIEGAGLAHVFWQPDSGRLVTLANLAS